MILSLINLLYIMYVLYVLIPFICLYKLFRVCPVQDSELYFVHKSTRLLELIDEEWKKDKLPDDG